MSTDLCAVPDRVNLKDCPTCLSAPQIFPALDGKKELWVIVCPTCGFQMVGKRDEGLGLRHQDIVQVLKCDDDLGDMIGKWNRLDTAGTFRIEPDTDITLYEMTNRKAVEA